MAPISSTLWSTTPALWANFTNHLDALWQPAFRCQQETASETDNVKKSAATAKLQVTHFVETGAAYSSLLKQAKGNIAWHIHRFGRRPALDHSHQPFDGMCDSLLVNVVVNDIVVAVPDQTELEPVPASTRPVAYPSG
ncbi:MAG: hypothetical protein IPN76_06780 [Saprospiraceae bacterium]|nr:hypothetical protein [Saprospiraceae bacterium]